MSARFDGFVAAVGALLDTAPGEPAILSAGARLLGDLVAHDDWLADRHAQPDPARYRQFRLHVDPDERFSVVSFVWGPGQATPVHDHRIWGLIGVLRGAEVSQRFARTPAGLIATGAATRLAAGQVDAVSPAIGDLHRVGNAHDDCVSISIHLYGADIGRVERATYDADGSARRFVSGYADEVRA